MKFKSILFILLMSSQAWATLPLEEFHIFRATSIEELTRLSDSLGLTPDDATGLALAEDHRVLQQAESTGLETTFNLGDYAIFCFRSAQSTYIRIEDETPRGETQALFPHSGWVRIEAARMYCVGDSVSSAQFYADQASGTGSGKLSIIISDSADSSGRVERNVPYNVQSPIPAQLPQDDQQSIVIHPAETEVECLTATVSVYYQQQIALTPTAQLTVSHDGTNRCPGEERLLPSSVTHSLNGYQVPFPIEFTCPVGSSVDFLIYDHGREFFRGTGVCSSLRHNPTIELARIPH